MIYLQHGAWSAGTLTWSSEQAINPLQMYEYENPDYDSGRDLHHTEYRSLLSKRKVWDFIVSADELYDDTKFTFMKNFYNAIVKRFSLETDIAKRWTVNDTTIKTVVTAGGKIPLEFLNGNKYLREITLELMQKEPD